jgi:hypothetical protein
MALRRKRIHGKTQTTQIPITLGGGLGRDECVRQAMGRVVNQHFYRAERLLGAVEKLRNCGELTQISFPGLGLSSLPPDRLDNLLRRPHLRIQVQCFSGPAGFNFPSSLVRQGGRLPEIVNKHPCSLACECLGGGGTDSLRVVPTGDANHFASQLGINHSASASVVHRVSINHQTTLTSFHIGDLAVVKLNRHVFVPVKDNLSLM